MAPGTSSAPNSLLNLPPPFLIPVSSLLLLSPFTIL